jgi:hypothetical protein
MSSLAITVNAAGVQVMPGQAASFTVEVRNLGTVVDRYHCEIVGMDPGWVTVTPASLELFPQRELDERGRSDAPPTVGRFTVALHPPRSAAAVAGAWPIGAKVASEHDPANRLVEEATITMLPFGALDADLRPALMGGRFGASTALHLANRGNRPEAVTITGTDRAERIDFRIDRPILTLQPGETVNVKLRLSGGDVKLVGGADTRPFTLDVRANSYDTAPLSLSGTYERRALIPTGLPVAGATLAALAMGGLALVQIMRPPGPPGPSPDINRAASPTIVGQTPPPSIDGQPSAGGPSAGGPSAGGPSVPIVSPTPPPTPPPDAKWTAWSAIHSATKMAPGATVTTLVPRADHVDLFTSRADGAILSSFRDAGGPWNTWFQISGGVVKPGATITPLVPRPDHIDLFVTGTDNTVYTTWWEPAVGWQSWFQIHPETLMAPGSTITALVPRENHIDLFTTRADGLVMSTYWEPAVGWQPWFAVAGGQIQPAATVTALVPRANHIDLFAVGLNNSVWSTWWEPAAGWQGWFQIHGENAMAPGATVTAIVPRPDHIDLFASQGDGTVMTASWEPSSSWLPWSAIHPELKMASGATVSAVTPRSDRVELFVTRADGTVRSTFWEGGRGWRSWYGIKTAIKMRGGATVAALPEGSSRIDLFATRSDGTVRTSSWQP